MRYLLKYDVEILSTVVFVVLQTLLFVLLASTTITIIVYILISSIIIITAIIDGNRQFKKHIQQIELESITTEDQNIYTYHQVILPIALYIGTVSFLMLQNLNIVASEITIIITSILLYTLLKRIDTYMDTFNIEESTHYLFNGIKIYIFFILTYSFLEISSSMNVSMIYSILFIFILSLSLLLLLIQRNKQFVSGTVIFAIISAIVITASGVGVRFTIRNTLVESFITTGIFFLSSAVMHHKMEGKLSRNLLIEYSLILIIMLLIIKGIVGIYQ